MQAFESVLYRTLHSARIHPRWSVTNNEAVLVAAKLGCGLTRLLFYQAAEI